MPLQLTLPTELWITIIDCVNDSTTLLVLSQTSRTLHTISLEAFFEVMNFDWKAPDFVLKSHLPGRNREVLRGLCCSLETVGRSLEEIVYDCGETGYSRAVIDELRLFSSLFLRISSVNRVTLRICSPPSMHIHELHEPTIDVLISVIQAKCRNIHVTTTQLAASHKASVLTPQSTLNNTISRPSVWLKGILKREARQTEEIHLERCSIQTFPHFLRPFYLSTLQAHSNILTSLEFKNIFGGEPDFSTLLSLLYLPHLNHFSIKYASILRLPLLKFFSAHSHIDSLEYHHIRYQSNTTPSRQDLTWRSDVTQNKSYHHLMYESLRKLHTSPEQLVHFFPVVTQMPLLHDVIIGVESHENSDQFTVLDKALDVLSHCVNPIKLHLRVYTAGLGLTLWLGAPRMVERSNRPELKMRAVETLVLDNGAWELNEDFYRHLIPWVGMFPAVKELTLQRNPKTPSLTRRVATEEDSPLSGTFAARLKVHCPTLKSVTILSSFEWTHRYD
ncbi:hypothetical protein CPB83DRAFT_651856 [Crepidotus variabilis]|uniref:F-box domain-containing protein n=1 Tax=Crepidotus variabilis TaxID=179855 RepID=A0A9P6E742_9AGAR|nr:hypothetical protein CPB83DRAFT_651856 [Crepidotus variabilis]